MAHWLPPWTDSSKQTRVPSRSSGLRTLMPHFAGLHLKTLLMSICGIPESSGTSDDHQVLFQCAALAASWRAFLTVFGGPLIVCSRYFNCVIREGSDGFFKSCKPYTSGIISSTPHGRSKQRSYPSHTNCPKRGLL